MSGGIPLGSVIKFDVSRQNELTIPVQIRYENVTETLKARVRIVSGGAKQPTASAFKCPEPLIVANGTMRREWPIVIGRAELDPGVCSRIDFVVSADFQDCMRHPDWFDATTSSDNDEDLGRATFWVWDVSNDPLTSTNAQALLNTCLAIDRTVPAMPTAMEN
jgi:hypothetical protein